MVKKHQKLSQQLNSDPINQWQTNSSNTIGKIDLNFKANEKK